MKAMDRLYINGDLIFKKLPGIPRSTTGWLKAAHAIKRIQGVICDVALTPAFYIFIEMRPFLIFCT
jgi:hypothetical protein